MAKRDYLDDISTVVMGADSPSAALDDLANTLPKHTHNDIAITRDILMGNVPNEKALKKSNCLWSALFRLAKGANQPLTTYFKQYQPLSTARLGLEDALKTPWLAYLYFFWLTLVLLVSLSITVRKTLPNFEALYQDLGTALPTFTQIVLKGDFTLIVVIILLLIAIIAVFVPSLYRQRMKRLLPIPFYLRLFPFYFLVTRHYHRYLHCVFTGVYQRVGEDNPMQRGGRLLPKVPAQTIDTQLLQVALRQGSFEPLLAQQQQKVADLVTKQMRFADSLIGGLVLMVYAWIVYAYMMGIYLPIFSMGEAISG